MKKILSFLLFLFIFFGVHESGLAQEQGNFSSITNFKRELDHFNWLYLNKGNWNIKKWDLGFNSSFTSRMFLFNKAAQNVQDETMLQSWVSYPIFSSFKVISETDYYAFTNTQVRNLSSRFGLVAPLSFVYLKPMLGYYSDTRSDKTDDGLYYSLYGKTDSFIWDENLSTSLEGLTAQADIHPRAYSQAYISSKTVYASPELNLQLNGALSNNERDSYQPSSFFNRNLNNIIERVTSDTSLFSLNFQTKINENVQLTFSGFSVYNVRKFENKVIGTETENSIVDTRYTRQDIEGNTAVNYQFNPTQGQLGFRYSVSGLDAKIIQSVATSNEQLLRREEQLRNTFYDQEITELYFKNTWKINQAHTLQSNATVSMLRFDTPETNFDDRDELFSSVEFEHRYLSGANYETSVNFSGEWYHRVFLFSQRSIENNIRRSVRLQPSINWFPIPSIRWKNQFMVRANYTVYDFPGSDGTLRDQSSREWGLSSDIRWEMVKNLFAGLLVSRNQLIIGQLFWNDFSETPIDTLTTTRIEPSLSLQKENLFIKIGARIFIKDDYIPLTLLNLKQDEQTLSRFVTGNQQTLQWGPMLSLSWRSSRYGEISIDGWLQLQYLRNQWYADVPDSYQKALAEQERLRRTRIFPNLSIHTKLYL